MTRPFPHLRAILVESLGRWEREGEAAGFGSKRWRRTTVALWLVLVALHPVLLPTAPEALYSIRHNCVTPSRDFEPGSLCRRHCRLPVGRLLVDGCVGGGGRGEKRGQDGGSRAVTLIRNAWLDNVMGNKLSGRGQGVQIAVVHPSPPSPISLFSPNLRITDSPW